MSAVSAAELVALVCCDLGSIVRGRSLPASELGARLDAGVGWVPANQALTPLGPLAEPNPFGSTGDLRLLPDPDTHVRVAGVLRGERARVHALRHRRDRRATLGVLSTALPARLAARARATSSACASVASFEHEFQLLIDSPPAPPFSLEAQRRAEPFAADLMGALAEAGVQPELFTSEYAPHQFEIPRGARRGARRRGPQRRVQGGRARARPPSTSCARASRRCWTPPGRATACTSISACSTTAGVPRSTTPRARRA